MASCPQALAKSDVLFLPLKQISKVLDCFLQAFVPVLYLADITTVSVFICEIRALEVYEIGSFLCSSLWHNAWPLSPVTPSSCELLKDYLAGTLALLIF